MFHTSLQDAAFIHESLKNLREEVERIREIASTEEFQKEYADMQEVREKELETLLKHWDQKKEELEVIEAKARRNLEEQGQALENEIDIRCQNHIDNLKPSKKLQDLHKQVPPRKTNEQKNIRNICVFIFVFFFFPILSPFLHHILSDRRKRCSGSGITRRPN